MTYAELGEGFQALKIDQHLAKERQKNGWYRYVEAQIWADPDTLRGRFGNAEDVTPEPWTYQGVTYA